MTKRFFISIGMSALALSASALDIQVTPGSLIGNFGDLKCSRDAELTLRGQADVRDLILLRDMARTITRVDMSNLEVVGYTYPGLKENYMGQRQFADGELPKAMLLDSNVSEFLFPSNTAIIGSSAFASTPVSSLVLPATVTAVGDNAWAGCDRLVSVSIPSQAVLGKGVFKGCKALTGIEFGYDVTEIPEAAFDGCVRFTTQLPATVKAVGAYAYRATALSTLDLSNVSSVGDFAFAEMPNLADLTVDATNRTTYGTGAFYGDDALLVFPATGESVPALLLANASSSDKANVEAEVVGEGAYANNSAITEIRFSPRLRQIKAQAFRNVKNLRLVDVNMLGSNIPETDPTAFAGLENEDGRYHAELNVAKDTQEAWGGHPVWGLFNIISGGSEVGVVTPQTPMNVKISRLGDVIEVDANNVIEYFAVYGIDGTLLHESRPLDDRFQVSGIPTNDVVIVKLEHGKNIKVVKLAPAN